MNNDVETQLVRIIEEIVHLDEMIECSDPETEIYGRRQVDLLRDAKRRRLDEAHFLRKVLAKSDQPRSSGSKYIGPRTRHERDASSARL